MKVRAAAIAVVMMVLAFVPQYARTAEPDPPLSSPGFGERAGVLEPASDHGVRSGETPEGLTPEEWDGIQAQIAQAGRAESDGPTPEAIAQTGKLTAPDGVATAYFGFSVSVDCDTAVIGAYNATVGGNAQQGAAYVYSRNQGGAGTWGQVAELTAADGVAGDQFGYAVSVDGDRIAISAIKAKVGANASQGAVYVFYRNQGGADAWGQARKLVASDGAANESFGIFISVDGDTLAVGTPYARVASMGNRGAVYLFSRNLGGADNWGQAAKLIAADGVSGDFLGYAVSLDGDTVVAGAPYAPGATAQGAAYVYYRNQGGADAWGLVTKLTASDGAANAYFGRSVSLDGDTVVIGAHHATVGGKLYQGAAYVFYKNQGGANAWGQVAKLTASDGQGSDYLGASVWLDGDTAVVGAYNDYMGAINPGSAYVFSRNWGGADAWGQVKKLNAADGTAGSSFGFSVCADGDTILVGAYEATVGGNAQQGAAYVFTDPSICGDQVQKKTPSDGASGDRLGSAVAVAGDTALVGAMSEDGGAGDPAFDAGAAYVFTRNLGGADTWGQAKILHASDLQGNDNFGRSVNLSGDTAVIGAPLEDGGAGDPAFNAGAAYVFSRNLGGADNWGQVKIFHASDLQGGDNFGSSVSISGDTAVVGAPLEDGGAGDPALDAGAVYVFSRNQGGADNWGQVTILRASDMQAVDNFGSSVSLSGDTAVVGAIQPYGGGKGAAYIFSRNQGGADAWGQVAKLTAADGVVGDRFGSSVAVDGDTVVIGAIQYYSGGEGAAYIYSRNQGGADAWGQAAKLTAADGLDSDQFGYSASMAANTVVIGAVQDAGGRRGAAYLFSRNQGGANAWGQVLKLTASDGGGYDVFGNSVSVSGGHAIIGAPGANVGTSMDMGAAYAFNVGPCPCAEVGLTANNTAADLDVCAPTGVRVTWPQDPADWGDLGAGTRTYDVLRGGSPIQSAIAYGTVTYTDTTGALGTSYTYAVRYNNGCGTSATTAGVNAADAPALSFTASTVPVTCFGMSDGVITVAASGGTQPMTYSKDGATYQSSNVFSGLAAGSYTIIVKDASGCTQSSTVFVSGPGLLTVSLSSTNPTCHGASDGSITITPVSGGTPPFFFSIDGVNYQASNLFLNLVAADYEIYVKDDAGCMLATYATLTQPTAVALSPLTLPGGTPGSAYSQTITASGGTGPYGFTVTAGTLPDGLTLAADGTLSGTPTVVNTFSFTVTATDAIGCTGSQAYTVAIACPTVVTNLNDSGVGSLRWVVANACPGATVTFDPGVTGAITLSTGAVPIDKALTIQGPGATLLAVDGGGLKRVFYHTAGAVTISGLTIRNGYDFDHGGGFYSSAPLSLVQCTVSGNTAWATQPNPGGGGIFASGGLSLDGCTISGNQMRNGGYGGGVEAFGSPYTLTNTTISGNYCSGAGALYAANTDGTVLNCTITNNSTSTYNFNPAGFFVSSGAIHLKNSIVAGNTSLNQYGLSSATLDDQGGNLLSGNPLLAPLGDYGGPTQTHALLCGSPALDSGVAGFPATDQRSVPRPQSGVADCGAFEANIFTNPSTLPQAQTGTAYPQTLTATGGTGPYTFTAIGTLPTGLSLVADGSFSGIPTTLGVWTFTVVAKDSNGFRGICEYTLTVSCGMPIVVNPAVTAGTVGIPFSQSFTQSGGVAPVKFSTENGLPAGLTLAANGTLSGTPTVTGTFNIMVVATDVNFCMGVGPNYHLVISCPTITVTNPAVTAGAMSAPFSQTFTQTGGIAPVTFTTGDPLPNGLSLFANGILSGTPTQMGTFPIVVTTTDTNGCTGTGSTYTLVIGCPVIAITDPIPNFGSVDIPYSQAFTAAGGMAPYTFTATGTFPPGLALASDGTLSGTPTATGAYPVTVTATDANGCAGSKICVVTILPHPGPAWAWGHGTAGELGNGGNSNSNVPVQTSLPPGTFVTAVSGGGQHSLALTSTGSVLAWGGNSYGQLGNGTNTASNVSVAVSLPPGTTVTAIAASGTAHSLALTSTGQVLAWGLNMDGQLGNGTNNNSNVPLAVSLPAGTTVTAVAAGYRFSMALTSTGQVYAWGDNSAGELGNGNFTGSKVPVAVSLPPGAAVTGIAAGYYHALAITGTGGLLAWGSNYSGQLGDGTTTNSNVPITPSLPGGTTVTAVAGGWFHSLVLTGSGSVLACGGNSYGQIGDGTNNETHSWVPVALPAGATVTQIDTGPYHSLALRSGGTILAWGNNAAGELGDGSNTNSNVPVQVQTLSHTLVISGGGGYSMAIDFPCPTITVTNPVVTTGTVSSPYSQAFTQSGGVAPVTFSTASALPTGLTLAADGTLSGAPTINGTFPITVTATDANHCTGSGAVYNLLIGCQTITVTNPAVTSGTVNAAFNQTFTQSGGIVPVTFSTSSALPAGLTLATDGTLSGTPTAVGTFPILVTATDDNSCFGTGPVYSLTILCPAITLAALTNGTANTPYSSSAAASPAGTYTYAVTAGSLPPGLTLNTSTGAVTGTPTTNGTYSFTITATGWGTCTGSQAYTMTIACPTITLASLAATGTANTPYSSSAAASPAGTYTYAVSAGSLPPGLTLNTSTGAVTGTPTTNGTYTFTVTATGLGTCIGSQAYTVTISCPTITLAALTATGTANTPYSSSATASPAGTYTYAVTAGSLPPGLTLNTSTGAVNGTPTTNGTYTFTITATGWGTCTGSQAYSVTISCPTITLAALTATGTANTAYSSSAAASPAGTYTYAVTAGSLPPGLALNTSTGAVTGTPTTNGTYNFTITATGWGTCTGNQATTLTIACPAITLSPASPLPNATVGSAYSQTFSASPAGTTYTFAVTAGSLPPGLTLNGTTGALSGTVTAAGSYTFTVTATGWGTCTGSQAYTLQAACPAISVSPASIPAGTVGAPYAQTFTASGGYAPYTYSVSGGGLPPGLTLSASGALSGTPSLAGSYTFTVMATDKYLCAGTRSLTVTMVCPAITVTPDALPAGQVGLSYAATLGASGGTAPYAFAVTSGTLPPGLTLAAGGALSGIPTAGGTFTFTVTATDTFGCSASRSYTIAISAFDLSFYDDYGRSRVCVNSITGSWRWTVLQGVGVGTYTGGGTASWVNNVLTITSKPGAPYTFSLRYMRLYSQATASYSNPSLRIRSLLTDSNTKNDPPGC